MLAIAVLLAMSAVSGGIVTARAVGPSFDHAKLAQTARNGFIIPAYRAFDASLARFQRAHSVHCAPSRARPDLSALRPAFRDVIAGWGGVELISFGPIAERNRRERIFFWPDRRGIGRRQVLRLVRSRSTSVVEPQTLGRKSVAVQGLGALELLLYRAAPPGGQDVKADAYRCRYARAIIANVRMIIANVLTAWSRTGRFTQLWLKPGPNNPAYLDVREPTLELVKAYDQALEEVRDRRIAPALGFGPRRTKRRPVLWRSRLTMVLISANLRAARALYTQGGLAQAYLARFGQTEASIAHVAEIRSALTFASDSSARLAQHDDPFALQQTARKLIAIGLPLKRARVDAVTHLKRAADLSLGFNASDGD
ncbi:MAG: imelysin family protein [Pseudomonadota bacterium]